MKSPMSTAHFTAILLAGLFSLVSAQGAMADDGPIKPFKDELFSRTKVLQQADGGDFKVMDYQEMRDINGRDQELELHVKAPYVDLRVKRFQQDETLSFGGRNLDVTRVGQAAGENFVVIFIHGRGGDRRLGASDGRFGGNFNRLKNLSIGNGGTYYSVSVPSFDAAGAADIGHLIRYAFEQSAGHPVILACASMGSIICQHVSRDPETVRYLGGMVLMSGAPDPGFPTTPFAKLKLPLYLAHGSADSVYPPAPQQDLYRKLHSRHYPVRLTIFNTGGHGTPLRMMDWREVLNFELNSHK